MNNWRRAIKANIVKGKPYAYDPAPAEVKLDQNENPYDIPDDLKQEILDTVKKLPWNRYSSLTGEPLRQGLSRYLDLPVERIAVGVGADEMINTVLSLVLAKGKTLFYAEPTYSMYKQCAATCESEIVTVPLNPDFSYPVAEMVSVINECGADLVMITSPNNPTGTVIPLDGLEEILRSTCGLVVVDEAYIEFSGRTALPLQEKYSNLVLIRTFSKVFGLAGMRIGYLLAQPEIVDHVHTVKMPFSLNIFSETAAVILLENKELVDRNREKIMHEKRRLFDALKNIPGLQVIPSETNFFIADVGRNGKQIVDRCAERGIAVRDISAHPMLENFIRFSVGTSEENTRIVQTLQEIFNGAAHG